jgi:lysophospholipase L1-like esterase
VTLVALLGTGCSVSRDDTPAVVLIGDSIALEVTPYLRSALDGPELVARTFGGSAPCDWPDVAQGLRRDQDVVISFIGNSLTDCMADGAGGHLQGAALVERYRADVAELVEQVRSAGATVLLVGQPQRGPIALEEGGDDPIVAGLNEVYAELAQAEGVSFVDAGAALEGDDGSFAAELPCLPEEPECGPDGVNPVRSDDGVHLCPGPSHDPCPVYSSGAFRFARAIAEALDRG